MINKWVHHTIGPNAHRVYVGNDSLYFSYAMCVAFMGVSKSHGVHVAVRLESPSVTTSKHMTQMGVKYFTVVSEEEFYRHINGEEPKPASTGDEWAEDVAQFTKLLYSTSEVTRINGEPYRQDTSVVNAHHGYIHQEEMRKKYPAEKMEWLFSEIGEFTQ